MSEVIDPSLEDRSTPRGKQPLAATLWASRTVHSATCIYRYADEYTAWTLLRGSMIEKGKGKGKGVSWKRRKLVLLETLGRFLERGDEKEFGEKLKVIYI